MCVKETVLTLKEVMIASAPMGQYGLLITVLVKVNSCILLHKQLLIIFLYFSMHPRRSSFGEWYE